MAVTNTEQLLELLVSASQNPDNAIVQERAVAVLDNLLDILVKQNEGSPFITVGSGEPTSDEADAAYRTGLTGFGEETPEELIDGVGTEEDDTGSLKWEYTYLSGAISRFAIGGINLLTELGLDPGSIEGNLFDFFGRGAQAGYRAYIYNGDIGGINPAAGQLSVGMGIQTAAGAQTCGFTVFTADNADGTEYSTRMINTHTTNGTVYVSLTGNGTAEFSGDILADIIFDSSRYVGFSKYYNLFTRTHRFVSWNTKRTGDTSVAHPNGGFTQINDIAHGVGVDNQGFLRQINGSYAGTAPSSASDDGDVGEVRVDGSFIYLCTATDTWERAALTFATW